MCAQFSSEVWYDVFGAVIYALIFLMFTIMAWQMRTLSKHSKSYLAHALEVTFGLVGLYFLYLTVNRFTEYTPAWWQCLMAGWINLASRLVVFVGAVYLFWILNDGHPKNG